MLLPCLPMTLPELLANYGIHTIRALRGRTGLSSQQCWNLWHGRRGVGRQTMKLLHERIGIPYEALQQVDAPLPRRKRPAQPPPEEERHQ
jgi:hypothetical protein